MKTSLTTFIIILGAFSLRAQNNPDCLRALEAIFDNFEQLSQPVPNGKTYFIDYTVEATLLNHQNQAGKQRIQAVFTHDRIRVKNDYLELHMDDQNTFTVLAKNKKVLWSSSTKDFGNSIRRQYTLEMKDSLLDYSTITKCQTITWNNNPATQVTLTFTPRGQEVFRYKEVTLTIDPKTNFALNLKILFAKHGTLKKVIMEVNAMDLNYKGALTPFDFSKRYITNDQLVHARFKDFQLQDLRK